MFTTIMPTITDKFNSLSLIGWYGSAYLLAMCTSYQTLTNVYLHYQPKYIHLASLFIFEIGCVFCGTATGSASIILGRTISGIGAAGSMLGTIFIVVHMVSWHRKAISILLVVQCYGVGRLVGPV